MNVSKAKLTPKVEQTLVNALKMGAPKSLACDLAGISRETLRIWLADPKNDVANKIAQSSADGRFRLLLTLRNLIEHKDTPAHVKAQSCMWLLERLDRENFGYKSTVTVEKVEPGSVTPEKAAELMRQRFGSVGPNGSTEKPPEPSPPIH